MRKTGLTVLMAAVLAMGMAMPVEAQTSGPPPDTNSLSSGSLIGAVPSNLWDYVTTGTNYWVAPFTTIAVDSKSFGGGIAVGYKVSELVNPVLRLDYFNGSVYMPSLTAQLQAPRSILGKIPVTPFGIAGMGTPIAGAGLQNGTAVTILGAGLALRGDSFVKTGLLSHMDLVADYEKWMGLPQKLQNQIRIGVLVKF